MSETDDTDELLLISPDTFLTNPALDPHNSDSAPYYTIVDTLITQVGRLENRVNSLQSSTDASLASLTCSDMLNSRHPADVSPQKHVSSVQSTPQKPRTKFTASSLPSTPSCARNTSEKLGEIDYFISNVKMLQRYTAARSLEGDFSSNQATASETASLDMKQVDEMLKELEMQQKRREKRISEKESEVFKRPLERGCVKERAPRMGDSADSVPDRHLAMRANMYPESRKKGRESGVFEGNGAHRSVSETSLDGNDGESSSEPTQMTVYEKKAKLQELDRNYNLGLVSLAHLWNGNEGNELPERYQLKIQEERMRRQHCEQTIQDLQNRVLELQERIAVAVQVDEAKDKAILRFHGSWEQSSTKIQEVEQENDKLRHEVNKLEKKIIDNSEEYLQKLGHYEREASKALNIAHTSQEKLIYLEKRFNDVENELHIAEVNSEEFQKKYLVELEKNKQYPEIIAQKELELNENKNILTDARNEVLQSRAAIEICQNEFQTMKKENESLLAKFDSGQEQIKQIIDQKNRLHKENESNKSAMKSLEQELTKARDQLENNKIELKNYYQGQVELVVQNKLKEFQQQLDEAEKKLKDELVKKELSIAKIAAYHIQQITDKHALEIKLVEEKHQEEDRLHRLKMAQMQRELDESSQKLKRQNEKHANIEHQLHKFMESLKQDATMEEMSTFRSKSFNNLEEILGMTSTNEEKANKIDNDLQNMAIFQTPLTTRNEKRRKDPNRDTNLQETIQMLLDKRTQSELRSVDDQGQGKSVHRIKNAKWIFSINKIAKFSFVYGVFGYGVVLTPNISNFLVD